MKSTRFQGVRIRTTSALATLLLFATLSGMPASAEEPTYLGRWKIVSAAVAPWATHGPAPDDRRSKALVGSIVTLSRKFVSGPESFPCSGPRYEVIEGTAEILFQGMFGEMQAKDPSVDPQKLAEQAGLSGSRFRTVVTGCEFAVDFSQGSDPNVAAFALDNFIYLMKRE